MRMPVLFTAEKDRDVFEDEEKYRTIDSTKNQMKVAFDGMETFSLNSANGYSWTKTITHNFGYRPQVLCWAYGAESNEEFTAMRMVSKFCLLPYSILMGTDPMTACLVASIERTDTYVKFKFFQQTDFYEYPPAPANFTLTDMKMKYLVFVDAE